MAQDTIDSCLGPAFGAYVGRGRWRDETGATHAYEIGMTLARTETGFSLNFRHRFPEEEGQNDVKFDASFTEYAPQLLSFDLGGLACRGHIAQGCLSYQIPLPGNLVEATFFFTPGACRVVGSSEKNSAGHAIAWDETLVRHD